MDNSPDYRNLLDLLAVYTEAHNRLAAMETAASEHLIDYVDDVRSDYARYQRKMAEAEASIRMIVDAHPEWFESQKSIKTPYGSVASRSTPRLDVPNPEASIILVQRSEDLDDAIYLRERVELNIEALETLDDAALKRLRIRRVKDESVSVKPARVDLGKAVKAKAEKDAA